MESIKDLLKTDEKYANTSKLVDKHKYVTTEFQDYGYRIAMKLGEQKRISLYIKVAKDKPRALVEQAYSFAIDYPNARNRGRLFMWKLKELEKDYEDRKKEQEESKSEEDPNKKGK
jgi:hypothetical protein